MACSGVRRGTGDTASIRALPNLPNSCVQISRPSSFKILKGGGRVGGGARISTAKTEVEPRRERAKGVVRRETLNRWMKESVIDIVKNLQDAPLFVNVCSSNDGEWTTLETERADEKDWAIVSRSWESGEAQMPEGIIFVKQIEDSEEEV